MPLVEWSEKLSVGIPEIDAEHQKLLAILNQLTDKVIEFQHEFEDNGRRITGKMVEFLQNWLTHHIEGDDMAFGHHVRNLGETGDPVATAPTPAPGER